MNFKILLFIALSFSLNVHAFDVNEKVFKDLNSTKHFNFNELITDKTLVVLFQPSCSACKKQIKSINCLDNIAKKIILVGSLGTEKKVKKSYLKKKTEYKAYYVQKENLNQIGLEDYIAPQVIFYSMKKNLKFMGYKSCKTLKNKIKEALSDDKA